MGAVLRAAIRVMNTAWWRAAQGNSHVQRPDRQILFHPVADSPANHAPREQVDDDGQINPALTRPDVGDVARPLLVRGTRRKVLLQEVRRDVEGVIAVGGALELAAADDADAVLAHQTAYPTLSDPQAQLVQLFGHPRPAVAAQAQPMLFADMRQDHHVAPLTDGRGPAQPRAQPAIRYAHHATEMAARKAAPIAGNELKPHGF